MGWLKLLILLPLSILFAGFAGDDDSEDDDDSAEDKVHPELKGFEDGMGNYIVRGETVPAEIAKAEAELGNIYNNHW